MRTPPRVGTCGSLSEIIAPVESSLSDYCPQKRISPLLPQWQALWPGPVYFGHPAPMWSNPGYSSHASVAQPELLVPDPCLDSAAEEFQDSHLDSQDQVQSSVALEVNTSNSAMVISHTTVEVHSVAEPPEGFVHSSLPSSSPRGASLSLPYVDINTDSDSPFAALTKRISLSYIDAH